MNTTIITCEIETLTRKFISKYPKRSLSAWLMLIELINHSNNTGNQPISVIELANKSNVIHSATKPLHDIFIDFGAEITLETVKIKNKSRGGSVKFKRYMISLDASHYLSSKDEIEVRRISKMLSVLKSINSNQKLLSPIIVLYYIGILFYKMTSSQELNVFVKTFPEKYKIANMRYINCLSEHGLIMSIRNGAGTKSGSTVFPVYE